MRAGVVFRTGWAVVGAGAIPNEAATWEAMSADEPLGAGAGVVAGIIPTCAKAAEGENGATGGEAKVAKDGLEPGVKGMGPRLGNIGN